MTQNKPHAIIIGAGIGGLATAIRLLAAGMQVSVFEAAATPGGKMRTLPSAAGPVDAGPTVMTMRWVFDDLFQSLGENLDDHVTLSNSDIIARHFWSDGTQLDLSADPRESAKNVADVFGKQAAGQLDDFTARAKRLFDAFDAPMMQADEPSSMRLAKTVLADPTLLRDMAPHQTLAQLLRSSFSEPKLRQLFGRYATYVGGSPYASPAILSLIWHAERSGVWAVKGGMYCLAEALEALAVRHGAVFHYGATITSIAEHAGGQAVRCGGDTHTADIVVFNGDPRALAQGHLGDTVTSAVKRSHVEPRSLSAAVYAFAATPSRSDLSHHNVFFGDDPHAEFDPIAKGLLPRDPTLYVCAQDRGAGATPKGAERFEIIMNAPPCKDGEQAPSERIEHCQTLIFDRLSEMGLQFSPRPEPAALTLPQGFNHLFPASLGSLYGRSPHGMTAGLKRPTARSRIKGLYLAGGGAHPGAGVPMAALSGQHAAEMIKADLGLTSTSRQTDMRGGTSTEYPTVAPAQSRSSPS